jgi:hypothetical protein
MRKGIPVQVITNDERRTESRDRTIAGKARDSRVLFGMACNLLGKIGSALTALSPDFAETMLANSKVIGYNIARVFPPPEDAARLLVRKRSSVPLSAPLVIFDNRGAHISHQKVYRLTQETLLFAEHGSEILSEIGDVDTLIIHKDGAFYPEELKHLKAITSQSTSSLKRVIPISIIGSAVPRMYNPSYQGEGFQLRAGTFLSLTPSDFVMTTTPTMRWKPEILGWPCPMLIRIHDKEMECPLASKDKLKLLNQIFALTKMHTGAQRSTRAPVSIHYSNMIARFLRMVGDPAPDYIEYFVRSVTEGHPVPRWYL